MSNRCSKCGKFRCNCYDMILDDGEHKIPVKYEQAIEIHDQIAPHVNKIRKIMLQREENRTYEINID